MPAPARVRRSVLNVELLEGRTVPAALTPGGIVTGSIDAASEADTWTFTGTTGNQVELITTSTATRAGFTVYTDVYAPSGTWVTGFWPGNNAALTLNETGTYSVKVRDDNNTETGQYTVGLETLNPISPNPSNMVKGGIVSGSIDAATEKDQWTFPGSAGARIELITTSTPTQAGFTAYADVYAPSGTWVTGFWPGNNVALTLPETGRYMIQIRDDNYVEKGSYTIGFEGITPLSPNPTNMVKGGIVSGSINSNTEKDQWTFPGSAGAKVELITTSTPTSNGFNAYADVYAPSGSWVTGFWPGNNVSLTLPESGKYMIQMRDDNYSGTGRYTIGFEGINPISPNPTNLVKGGIVSGIIGAATEKDQWTFPGSAGAQIELITTSTAGTAGFTAYADVYAPSGTWVTGFWPGNNVALTLPESGKYMIQIRDDNYTETGSYTIGYEGLRPTSPDAQFLAPGVTASGAISLPTEKDQWLMNVPAGMSIRVTLTGMATDGAFSAYANVYGPSGTYVGGTWAGTQTFTLSESGNHLIQVQDAGLSKLGTYTLTVQLV